MWSQVVIVTSLFHNWAKLAELVPGTPSHYLECISIGNSLCSPRHEVMVLDFSLSFSLSPFFCRLPYSKMFTLSLPHCCTFVGGVFTHFTGTRQCARRWGLRENPLPGATKQTREEMNTSPFFFVHTFTFYPSPPTPLSHSVTPGNKVIIQKVTCGLPLSPLPSRQHWGEKGTKNTGGSFNLDHPEQVTVGVTQASSSSHNCLSHHFLIWQACFFNSWRWNGQSVSLWKL